MIDQNYQDLRAPGLFSCMWLLISTQVMIPGLWDWVLWWLHGGCGASLGCSLSLSLTDSVFPLSQNTKPKEKNHCSQQQLFWAPKACGVCLHGSSQQKAKAPWISVLCRVPTQRVVTWSGNPPCCPSWGMHMATSFLSFAVPLHSEGVAQLCTFLCHPCWRKSQGCHFSVLCRMPAGVLSPDHAAVHG